HSAGKPAWRRTSPRLAAQVPLGPGTAARFATRSGHWGGLAAPGGVGTPGAAGTPGGAAPAATAAPAAASGAGVASVLTALVIAASSSEVLCLDAFSISSALGIVTAELFFWLSACLIFSSTSLALAACSS